MIDIFRSKSCLRLEISKLAHAILGMETFEGKPKHVMKHEVKPKHAVKRER